MAQDTQVSSWKSHLPELHSWAEQVSISTDISVPEASHHLLVIKEQKGQKCAYHIDAPLLPKQIQNDLYRQLADLGYRARPDIITLQNGDSFYLLVSQPEIACSSLRTGRQVGLNAAKALRQITIEKLCIHSGEDAPAENILEGLGLGLYQLDAFRQPSVKKRRIAFPKAVSLVGKEPADPEPVRTVLLSSSLCRMVADAPPNWLNPAKFAEIAESMSRDQKLQCTIRRRDELKKLGMGAFISVGNGSVCEPHLIEIQIKGHCPDKNLVLIGKGLTFDAGGVSLKPPPGMDEMKYDMCGGAAVLGAAYYLSRHKPPFNVVCLIGAVENLISGSATRPGDVVTSMCGKTIEVLNTDAEGRLVLADLLYYARSNWKADFIIDTATLTGAVLHALGSAGSAFISNNRQFSAYMNRIAGEAGDPLWEMPLWPELSKELRSEIADIKNIAAPGVKAGTLVGGAFLKEFVGPEQWAHIDIAGTGWNCKATGFPSSGSSSAMLKTLAIACLNYRNPASPPLDSSTGRVNSSEPA